MSTDISEKSADNPGRRSLDDISIFQLLEYLLGYRWLIIGLILAGAVLSGVATKIMPVETPSRHLVFSFYPVGSASYTPLALSDQLRTRLVMSGHTISSARGSDRIVVDIEKPEQQNTATQVADDLEATIDRDEATALAATRAIVSTRGSGDSLGVLLAQMAYESGRRNGSIDLISSDIVLDASGASKNYLTSVLSGAALGTMVSALVVALLTFVRNWRRYRNDLSIDTRTF